MGWVSLLEDAIERLSSDIAFIRSPIDLPDPNASLSYREKEFLHSIDRTLATIKKHLEIATDSNLELADELIKQEYKNKELQERIRDLEARHEATLINLRQKAREKQTALENTNKELQIRITELKSDLEAAKRKLTHASNKRDVQTKKLQERIKQLQDELSSVREALKRGKKSNNGRTVSNDNNLKRALAEAKIQKGAYDCLVKRLQVILEGPTATIRDRVAELFREAKRTKRL